ncbi:MAG: class II aldolase/adducin family protein [Bacteroidota bacterium]
MIIDKIYKGGLTTTSGGNISVIDKNGDVWVAPSVIDKGTLCISDFVCVKKDGTIEGRHKPSSLNIHFTSPFINVVQRLKR